MKKLLIITMLVLTSAANAQENKPYIWRIEYSNPVPYDSIYNYTIPSGKVELQITNRPTLDHIKVVSARVAWTNASCTISFQKYENVMWPDYPHDIPRNVYSISVDFRYGNSETTSECFIDVQYESGKIGRLELGYNPNNYPDTPI